MQSLPSLLKSISSVRSLTNAWNSLNKSNPASKGLSNVTIKEFSSNSRKHIKQLSLSLNNGSFEFSKVKGATIKKKQHGAHPATPNIEDLRPLRIPEIQDRIVHKALAIKLEKILAAKYKLNNRCSFAYQKGKNIRDAIIQMLDYYEQGYKVILEVDIIKFFDSVNSKSLLTNIKSQLKDNSIDDLLTKAIKQELGNIKELGLSVYEKHFKDSEEGIPQGNALSPLLANIFLSDFDKRALKENLKMIRYADDFIVMCKDRNEALRAFGIAKDELETKLGLSLHPLEDGSAKQSKIVDPRQHRFTFLSVRFDGENCTVGEKKVLTLIQKLRDLTSREELKKNFPKESIGLLQALSKIKNMLDGWFAAYYFLDIEKQLMEIDKHINVQLYRLLGDFSFKLEKKGLDLISFKGKSNKILALNKSQRLAIGVPFYSIKFAKARADSMALNEIVKLHR